MDNINIEIESSSEKASQGVNQLINTLSTLNTTLDNSAKSVNKYVNNISNLGNIGKNIKMPDFSKMNIFGKLKDSFKKQNIPEIPDPTKNVGKNSGDAKKRVDEVNSKFKELQASVNKIIQRIKDMFKRIMQLQLAKTGLKALNVMFGNFGGKLAGIGNKVNSLVKSLSKYALALYGIRSAFYAVRNVSKEFLSSQDAVAQQLSANIGYLKFSLGSLLAPVINYLTNLMYKLLQMIQYLVYYVAKINIFAGRSAKSYASMRSSASKTTKELQKQLQSFDELNNISLKNDSGGDGGAGGVTPSIDLSNVDKSLKPLFDDIDNWGKNLAQKINQALASINWDAVIEKTTSVTRRIANILNGFTSELDFGLLGYTIAQGFNTVFLNLNTFFDTYNFDTLGKKLTEGINSIISTLKWEELGKTLTNGFRSLIETLYPIVTDTHWAELGQGIGNTIMAGFRNIDWKKTGETINNGINGILDGLIAAIDSLNWDEVANDIATMLSQIKWGEIFSKVFQIAAKLVAGLGKILWESIFSGDGSLAVVLTAILGGAALKKAFEFFTKVLGTKIFNSLTQTSSGFKSLGSASSEAATGVVSLKTGFNDLLGSLGKATQIIATLGGLALVINSLTGLLEAFAKSNLSVGEALGFLGGTIGIITAAFAAMMGIMKLLEPSWQSIAGAVVILGGFALVINQVSNLLKVFAESGLQVNDVIGLMATVFVTLVALMASVALLGPAMTAGMIPFLAVVAGLSAILLVMSITIPAILDAAGTFIEKIGPTVITIVDKIIQGITAIAYIIGTTLPPIINAIGNVFGTIFNGIVNTVKAVGNVITNIFNGVSTYLSSIFKGIGTVFTSVFNGIGNVVRSIGSVITSVFNGVSNVINSIGNALTRVLNSIGNLVKTVLNSLLNFINRLGPSVENTTNAILRSVRNVINFMVSAIEFLVNNVVVRGINAIIDTMNKIPAVNISRASQVHLPRFSGYAEGGYPDQGEFFLAREAGPEMVGSIGNKTAVANNDQITKAIAQAAYQAMSQALAENSDSEQPINVYVGNEKLYSGYTKYQSQSSNQYGIIV